MIAIIDYGAGNVCSLQFALERLGVKSELTSDPNVIGSSEKVIFPGQGSAGRAMEKLKKTGVRTEVRKMMRKSVKTSASR